MMHFSVWHLITVLAVLALFAWPGVRILHKAGYSGWWIVLVLLPVVNLAAVWLFAYADWPRLRPAATPPSG